MSACLVFVFVSLLEYAVVSVYARKQYPLFFRTPLPASTSSAMRTSLSTNSAHRRLQPHERNNALSSLLTPVPGEDFPIDMVLFFFITFLITKNEKAVMDYYMC